MAHCIRCNEASSKLPREYRRWGKRLLSRSYQNSLGSIHLTDLEWLGPLTLYWVLRGLKNVSERSHLPGGHWPWTTAVDSVKNLGGQWWLKASVVLAHWRKLALYGLYAEPMSLAAHSPEFLVLFEFPQIICLWTTFPNSSRPQRAIQRLWARVSPVPLAVTSHTKSVNCTSIGDWCIDLMSMFLVLLVWPAFTVKNHGVQEVFTWVLQNVLEALQHTIAWNPCKTSRGGF